MVATLGTILLAIIAVVWVVQAVRAFFGMRNLPRLGDVPPLPAADCTSVSILFAARNEEEKLPQALATLLALDYPRYEMVAVNDRSSDATGRILEGAATRDARLRVLHVEELPQGWLGKPHGLQRAYESSSGDWLLFTDADVRFAPDVLRRSLALAQAKRWDHLVLIGLLDLSGFWEKVATVYFAMGFLFGVEPWQVSNPRSKRYMGVGYFQLLRRSCCEAIGGHRRLAMEVVDDMKLGKLVKLGGFRSGVARAEDHVRLRWNNGLREIVRNVEKNFFAVSDYSVWRVLRDVLGILLISVLPFVALPLTGGVAQLCAAISAGVALVVHGVAAYNYRVHWMYCVTHPIGALIFCYMLLRSTVITLRQGGIVWRGTFYPLSELRKGMV